MNYMQDFYSPPPWKKLILFSYSESMFWHWKYLMYVYSNAA